MSVSYEKFTYNVELFQRHPETQIPIPACTAQAADFDVAVVTACNNFERQAGEVRAGW
jgi:hypothetical protein